MTNTTTNTANRTAAGRKLNRAQKLLTADQARKLPKLYATDGKGESAVAYAKFFLGSYTWYATEFDPKTGTFFGLVDNVSMRDQIPAGELGYFTADELCTTTATVNVINAPGCSLDYSFRQSVERDIHWQPRTLAEIRDEIDPSRKLSEADREAMAEFDNFEPTTATVETIEAEAAAEPVADITPIDAATPTAAANESRRRFAANYAAINWGK